MARTKAGPDGSDRSGEALFIFALFHAKEGKGGEVSTLLRKEVVAARHDSGCVAHQAYRSTSDSRLYFIHSRWTDEGAFEEHLKKTHTVRFAERIEPLLDHELEVNRARPLRAGVKSRRSSWRELSLSRLSRAR